MKKIVALLAMSASLLMAQLGWADSYDAALSTAQKEGKLVMVMLSMEGCPACEYMQEVVFDDDNVVKELQSGFVPLYIDIHKDSIPKGLGYIGTPTFHFLTAEGTKVGRLDGGANVADFTEQIRTIKELYRN